MRKERKDSIDRDLFHVWLWENRKRGDVILPGAEVARRLSLSRFTPVRLFGELVAAGKLKKVGNGRYQVMDPEDFY